MDPDGSSFVTVSTRVGNKLGGGGEQGRLPIRVTIEGIPFYTQLYVKTVFDEWEMEYNPVGFYFRVSERMRQRTGVSDGQQLDLILRREEHEVRQRGGPVPKRLLDL